MIEKIEAFLSPLGSRVYLNVGNEHNKKARIVAYLYMSCRRKGACVGNMYENNSDISLHSFLEDCKLFLFNTGVHARPHPWGLEVLEYRRRNSFSGVEHVMHKLRTARVLFLR